MLTAGDNEFKKGTAYCIRLLSIRPRTEKEISERLGLKGYKAETVTSLIMYLQNKGLLDDLAFSHDWIDLRIRSNTRSKRMLENELIKKGIKPETIEKAFVGKEGILDDRANAKTVIERFFPDAESPGDIKTRMKIFRHLTSKGFDEETSKNAIEETYGYSPEG